MRPCHLQWITQLGSRDLHQCGNLGKVCSGQSFQLFNSFLRGTGYPEVFEQAGTLPITTIRQAGCLVLCDLGNQADTLR